MRKSKLCRICCYNECDPDSTTCEDCNAELNIGMDGDPEAIERWKDVNYLAP